MKNKDLELRSFDTQFGVNDRTVEGYAVVFDSESADIGWVEIIHRDAITEETIKNSDIFAKFNHEDDKVLARSRNGEGSLKLELDEHGLKYSFEAPQTYIGDELLEHLKRNEINQSSFAFVISKESDAQNWYKKDGVVYREINKIDKLFDVSPVFRPAYPDTECFKRAEDIANKLLKEDEIQSKMNLLEEQIILLAEGGEYENKNK